VEIREGVLLCHLSKISEANTMKSMNLSNGNDPENKNADLIGSELTIRAFGEIHGTREFPMIFLREVELSLHHQDTLVLLEYRQEHEALLQTFCRSIPESPETLEAHRALNSVLKSYYDGRGTEAMRDLITGLQSLHDRSDYDLVVGTFDVNGCDNEYRELAQANRLKRLILDNPCYGALIFGGNCHTRTHDSPVPWQDYNSALQILVKSLPDRSVESILLGSSQCSYWTGVEEAKIGQYDPAFIATHDRIVIIDSASASRPPQL